MNDMIMYKRLVGEYVKDELKKGRTIEQIKKRLIDIGYRERDVDVVLRGFEFRERDLRNKESGLVIRRTTANIWLVLALIIIVVNAAFFLYYFSNPSYVLVKETPTGFVTEGITKEELRNLEESFNVSDETEGLVEIS